MHFARNVHFQIKNGKDAEFSRILTNDVLPLLKTQKGFKEELTLVNHDRALGISVWEDKASAEKYQTSAYPQILEKLTSVIDGTPRVEMYDVVASTLTS